MPKWDTKLALRAIPKYAYICLYDNSGPTQLWTDLAPHLRYKISLLALIPSIVHQLVNYPGIEKVDFSSITTIGSGAAYLPPELGAKMSSLIPQESKFIDGSSFSFFVKKKKKAKTHILKQF